MLLISDCSLEQTSGAGRIEGKAYKQIWKMKNQ